MTLLMLLAALQSGPDTLRLTATEALQRALGQAGPVQAAAARERAAQAGIRNARAWYNPVFNATAENIGAQEQVTGKSGLEGLEGQVTLQQLFTLGGDRGAAVREAEALAGAAGAGAAAARADAVVGAVAAMAIATRDARVARHSMEEAATLDQLARAMTRRADEGRSSGGEAARVRLELATMRSLAARRGAVAAESQAELARRLGAPPGQPIAIVWPACTAAPAEPPVDSLPPDLLQARFNVEAARATADRARAARVPDIAPMAGLRRTAGYSGLLLGLSMELPLLRSGAAAEESARFQADAAEALRVDLERRTTAQRAGADAALASLAQAAPAFDATLLSDLERAVRAQQTRIEQGEGTIAELLDARRARVNTLNEYAEWRAMRAELRARRARLAGRPVDAQVLCEDLDLEIR
ncbi:MAG TPA: TolC family protein [Gemmatimonadales bacterium]|nr:TolC family protein [Gemmatimonadales bacterium]